MVFPVWTRWIGYSVSVGVGASVWAIAVPAWGQMCPTQLSTTARQTINRVGGQWSVLVQTQGAIGQRQNLLNINGSTLLIPASNNKVFTTAAALKKLGPQYRIRTTVTGNTSGASLSTVRILGKGDPSLTTTQLVALTQQLKQKGVRQIGQLIGDDTYFQGPAFNPFWDEEDRGEAYAVPVNSLILNQNAINLRLFPQQVGQALRVQWEDPTDASEWRVVNQSITVRPGEGEVTNLYREGSTLIVDAALQAGSDSAIVGVPVQNVGNYLVRKWRSVLTSQGMTVGSSTLVKSKPAPPGEIELAAVDSPPLSELIYETNQESNNTYAEALLKILGRLPGTSADATTAGVAAVRSSLTEMGVNPNRYRMVDGSGLADRNRASAEALVQTLQAVALLPDAGVYRRSLPIAGQTGTLKQRFRGTPAQGIVLAKTGTITGAVSLAGYITPPNHPPLVFAIVVNSGGAPSVIRRAVDELVVNLARLRSC